MLLPCNAASHCFLSLQGLGFPTSSSQNLSQPFLSMLELGVLDAPLFTLWLNPISQGAYAGELAFGTVNPKRYFGNIRYAGMASKGR